jgi:hypothetical protein
MSSAFEKLMNIQSKLDKNIDDVNKEMFPISSQFSKNFMSNCNTQYEYTNENINEPINENLRKVRFMVDGEILSQDK